MSPPGMERGVRSPGPLHEAPAEKPRRHLSAADRRAVQIPLPLATSPPVAKFETRARYLAAAARIAERCGELGHLQDGIEWLESGHEHWWARELRWHRERYGPACGCTGCARRSA